MWTVITIVSVIATVVVLGMWAVSARPSKPDPDEQPVEPELDASEYPDIDDDVTPRQPDGSPVPGSEADRNRHGQK